MGGTTKLLAPHLLPRSFHKELTAPAWSHQGIHLLEEVLRKDNVRAGSFNTHYVFYYVLTYGTNAKPGGGVVNKERSATRDPLGTNPPAGGSMTFCAVRSSVCRHRMWKSLPAT